MQARRISWTPRPEQFPSSILRSNSSSAPKPEAGADRGKEKEPWAGVCEPGLTSMRGDGLLTRSSHRLARVLQTPAATGAHGGE